MKTSKPRHKAQIHRDLQEEAEEVGPWEQQEMEAHLKVKALYTVVMVVRRLITSQGREWEP